MILFEFNFGLLAIKRRAFGPNKAALLAATLYSLCVCGCTFQAITPPAQPGSSPNKTSGTLLAKDIKQDNSRLSGSPTLSESARLKEANKDSRQDPLARSDIKLFREAAKEPLSPENTEELLNEVGSNWLYGQGMGETAATVGTIVVFPPYALWVVGNAALQLSGEEPIEVSRILPEESGKIWRTTYDEITSVPGRTSAAVAREEYRDQDVARERIEAVLKKNSEQSKSKRQKEKQLKVTSTQY